MRNTLSKLPIQCFGEPRIVPSPLCLLCNTACFSPFICVHGRESGLAWVFSPSLQSPRSSAATRRSGFPCTRSFTHRHPAFPFCLPSKRSKRTDSFTSLSYTTAFAVGYCCSGRVFHRVSHSLNTPSGLVHLFIYKEESRFSAHLFCGSEGCRRRRHRGYPSERPLGRAGW
jgi:hypothetical protein